MAYKTSEQEKRDKEENLWCIIFYGLLIFLLAGFVVFSIIIYKKNNGKWQLEEENTAVVEQEVPVEETEPEKEDSSSNVTINIQNIENIENFDVDTLLEEGGVNNGK